MLDAVPNEDAENHVVQQTNLKTKHVKDQCDMVPEVGTCWRDTASAISSIQISRQGQ